MGTPAATHGHAAGMTDERAASYRAWPSTLMVAPPHAQLPEQSSPDVIVMQSASCWHEVS